MVVGTMDDSRLKDANVLEGPECCIQTSADHMPLITTEVCPAYLLPVRFGAD